MTKDFFKNVLPGFNSSIIHKSAKKGQKSFRITQQLLQNVWAKCKKLKQAPLLIIKIPANKKEDFVIVCQIRKERKC